MMLTFCCNVLILMNQSKVAVQTEFTLRIECTYFVQCYLHARIHPKRILEQLFICYVSQAIGIGITLSIQCHAHVRKITAADNAQFIARTCCAYTL